MTDHSKLKADAHTAMLRSQTRSTPQPANSATTSEPNGSPK